MTAAAARILLAAALVLASAAAAGCGARDFIEVPEAKSADGKPGASEKAPTGVAVTVIDHNSRPVKGAAVGIVDATGRQIAADVATDATGRAHFAKVPPGKGYSAVARFEGLTASHALDVEGEAQVLVSILLAPSNGLRGMVTGTIFDGYTGQPLHGATVSVVGTQNTVASSADGAFLIKDVPAGNPTVVAIFPGFREQRATVVLRGGQSVRIDLRLQPGSNPQRFGHTLIATAKAIVEVDKTGSRLWTTRRGGAQARLLAGGNVLVANSGGVDEIDGTGAIVWSYKPLLFGRLNNPQGAFRAASGNTFVADTDNHRVIEVSSSQQLQRALKIDLRRPMSVERVEARRTTLIADTGNNRVIEVDDQNRIVWGFGDGTPETLNKPTFATRLPNGNTLVVDTGNSRVLEITPNIRLAWDYGDNTRNTCFLPSSAVRLPNGNTLIADTGNNRVIEVGRQNEIVWRHDIDAPTYAERL